MDPLKDKEPKGKKGKDEIKKENANDAASHQEKLDGAEIKDEIKDEIKGEIKGDEPEIEDKNDGNQIPTELKIPDATKLDLELPNFVFFKANKPLGEASYKLLEDRVDAINKKHSEKLTVILVPYSVDVVQE